MSRVLGMKDETSVRTNLEGMITPIDFTTFMRNYQDMVFSTAVRLVGNEAQAQDISQEVFLKAYQHFDQLETSPKAGGWLKKVATNLSLNHLTRYRNRWRFFSEFKRTGSDQDDTSETEIEFADQDHFLTGIDSDERKAWLAKALDQLPDHQRVPLVLYHFEDMPYDEIAKILRVSLSKVKTDILRARAVIVHHVGKAILAIRNLRNTRAHPAVCAGHDLIKGADQTFGPYARHHLLDPAQAQPSRRDLRVEIALPFFR